MSFVASLAAVFLIAPAPPQGAVEEETLESLRQGWRFLVRQRVILGTFVLDTNAMVFGMPQALFPAVARALRRGRGVVGLLYAAPAVGALVAALASGWIGHVRRQGVAVAAAIVLWGLAIVGFGLATALWLGLAMLARRRPGRRVQRRFSARPSSSPGRPTGCADGCRASSSPRWRARPRSGTSRPACVASLTSLRFSIVSGGIACAVGAVAIVAAIPASSATTRRAGSRDADALSADFFARSVHEVAPDLIGVTLLVDGVGGAIVEVEAYDPTDPAEPRLPRPDTRGTPSMFGPPGHAYVYRSYGIHWCLNLVCEEEGAAARCCSGRWSRPMVSTGCASGARSTTPDCSAPGPGRLCEALGVTGEHDGLPLDRPPFELRPREPSPRSSPRRASASPAPPTAPGATACGLALPQPALCPERDRQPGAGRQPGLRLSARTTARRARARRAGVEPLEPLRPRLADRQPDHARDHAVDGLREHDRHLVE